MTTNPISTATYWTAQEAVEQGIVLEKPMHKTVEERDLYTNVIGFKSDDEARNFTSELMTEISKGHDEFYLRTCFLGENASDIKMAYAMGNNELKIIKDHFNTKYETIEATLSNN